MRTRAAVCWEIGKPWEITELEIGEPGAGEALVKLEYAGLCHSDDHLITGDLPVPTPVVGGHEGAGEVLAVGPGTDRVAVGDAVLFGSTASCGVCRWCVTGRGHLCDRNADVQLGSRLDGSYVFATPDGQGVGSFCQLGSFSQYSLVPQTRLVRYDREIPAQVAAVASCAVATGYGSAVRVADILPGDTVVVVGVGGVGVCAVQGARIKGAARIVAVDPVESKRERAMGFGATHTASTVEEAQQVLAGLTNGVMAETAIITVSVLGGEMLGPISRLVGKGGTVVVTSVARWDASAVTLPMAEFFLSAKKLVGCVMGNTRPMTDFGPVFDLYRSGQLDIDGLITATYSLDEINDGYADMHAGRNLRGVIAY